MGYLTKEIPFLSRCSLHFLNWSQSSW